MTACSSPTRAIIEVDAVPELRSGAASLSVEVRTLEGELVRDASVPIPLRGDDRAELPLRFQLVPARSNGYRFESRLFDDSSIEIGRVAIEGIYLEGTTTTARLVFGATTGPHDGGIDSGTDGGIDSGTDGGTDAGTDGGIDSGIDGGLPVDVRITELVVPQPVTGDAFAWEYAFSHAIEETPHFVVSNVGTQTLDINDYEWAYILLGTTEGSGGSTGRRSMFMSGTSYTEAINGGAIAAGDYYVVACAWHVRELPDGGRTSWSTNPSFDPLHCAETTFAVSP